MKQYVLQTKHLTKKFKEFHALLDVSLELEKGKIYGLIGKNGAGKTTLMRIISGLSEASSGEIALFGKSDKKRYEKELKRIGTLIEYPTLNGGMTAKENMRLHRIIRGIPNEEREVELLELVGLGEVGNKLVKDFSLGMHQRLGIAIALLPSPELLILDEPVNGLDPVGVVEIRTLIRQLCEQQNMTILISSHNLPELYQTATDYIIIDQGMVKKTLTLEQLEQECEQYLELGCDESEHLVEVLERRLGIHHYKVMPDQKVRLYEKKEEVRRIVSTMIEEGILPTHIYTAGESLENYFLSVIGGE